MTLRSRVLIYILIVCVFVVLSVFVLRGIRLINPNRFKREIVSRAEKELNLKIDFGVIYPIIYPGFGFELSSPKAWFSDPSRVKEDFFQARSIKVILSLKELVKNRRLVFNEIIIDHPFYDMELSKAEWKRYKNIRKKEVPLKNSRVEENRYLSRVVLSLIDYLFPSDYSRLKTIFNLERVVVHDAAVNIYDRREFAKVHLCAPMEFREIELVIKGLRVSEIANFSVETTFPYEEKTGKRGKKVEGRGRLIYSNSLKRLDLIFDSLSWGDNRVNGLKVKLFPESGRYIFRGDGEMDLNFEDLELVLNWAPVRYSERISDIRIAGMSKLKFWFQFPRADGTKRIGYGASLELQKGLFNIAGLERRIKWLRAPLEFSGFEFKAENVGVNQEGKFWVQTTFPYERGSSEKGLEVEGIGRIFFSTSPFELEVNFDSLFWGKNRVRRCDLRLFPKRKGKPRVFEGNVDMELSLEDLLLILNWAPIKYSRVVEKMKANGKSRVRFFVKTPKPDGTRGFWYKGNVEILECLYDPGAIIAPIYGYVGEVEVGYKELKVPFDSFQIGKMEAFSDFRFSYEDRAKFYLKSQAKALDLKELFRRRARPIDYSMSPEQLLPPLRSVWEGEAKIEQASYNEFIANDVELAWSYKNRVLSFNYARFNYKDKGRYKDKGSFVDFRHYRLVPFLIEGKFSDIELAKFLKELLGIEFFIDGKMRGEGYIFGNFLDTKIQLQSLNGRFKVKVREGKLKYNLGARLLSFLNIKLKPRGAQLDFEEMNGEVIIKDGVIYFEDMVARSPTLEAHCTGWVNIEEQTEKLWVAIYPLEILSTLTKPIPLIGGLVDELQEAFLGYYAKMEGKWDKPRFSNYLPFDEKIPSMPEAPTPPENPAGREQ